MHDLPSQQCKSEGSPGHGQTGEGNFGEGLVRLSVNRVNIGEPHLRGHPIERPTPLERPLDNVNLNITLLISTPEERPPL